MSITLAFTASELCWQQYECPATLRVSDNDQNECEALTSFVNALYESHGVNEQASGNTISSWLTARKNTFFMMVKPLLARLNDRHGLSSVDLVVLAHWTHDTIIGHSVTNAVIHEINAQHAFGIALSDHGISGSWFALSLINDYLDADEGKAGERTALLLIADQSTALHNNQHLKNISAVPCAGAVLLRSRVAGSGSASDGSFTFKGYQKVQKSDSRTLFEICAMPERFFTAAESRFPLTILTESKLGRQMKASSLFNNVCVQIWDQTLMSVAPWAQLKQCATPQRRYLFIQEEPDAYRVAAFFSGQSACI
ncbi:hypothetical protein J8I88_09365 [Duffyella gerundensis]|uniref:hypothetical protein n=1 Tax=Duffyella gerundensis TaxID=1619313 RepID=UPI001AE217C6|nr:hypothetical protein [Duffyella gerundensis]QTO52791.1 hypothetical protein J8I88_09365 [Duffyella gerundensis]